MNYAKTSRNDFSANDRVESILLESKRFREACAKTMKISKALSDASSRKIDENQMHLEQSIILKEEIIANKCEAISIAKHAIKGKKIHDFYPVHRSCNEELKMVEEMLAELEKISYFKRQ